jgi:hypothetical protein
MATPYQTELSVAVGESADVPLSVSRTRQAYMPAPVAIMIARGTSPIQCCDYHATAKLSAASRSSSSSTLAASSGNAILGRTTIHIVDMPVFDPIRPRREVELDQRTVFSFLDRHHEAGRLEIFLLDLDGPANDRGQCDPLLLEVADGVPGDWPWIAGMHR